MNQNTRNLISSNFLGITRGILLSQGLKVPKGSIFVKGDKGASYSGGFPAVVKPTKMENSVGVELVQDREQMYAALERAWSYGDTAVVDSFIAGREIRCGSVEMEPGVIQPLGCIEYKVRFTPKNNNTFHLTFLENNYDDISITHTLSFV